MLRLAQMRGMRGGGASIVGCLFVAVATACAVKMATAGPEDAVVYRVALATEPTDIVLRRVVLRTSEPVEMLAIEGTVAERLAMHAERLPGLGTSTVRTFLSQQRARIRIPDLGDPGLSRVSRKEWHAIAASDEGWDAFFTRHPDSGGVTLLSRVAYSRDGEQALVYVTRACPLCGGADYLLLSRTGGQWRVVARRNDWAS